MSKKPENDYWVKQELVFQEYSRCLDLDLAITLVGLAEKEIDLIYKDEELAARMLVLDANNKTEMTVQLRTLSQSAYSESVRLAALKELGRSYYPKRFKEDNHQINMQRVIQYEVVGPS